MAVTAKSAEPTVMEMIADVAVGARDLAAAHAEQIKVEMTQGKNRAGVAGLVLEVGVAFLLLGVAFLLVALVNVLNVYASWPVWAAWLAVGCPVAIVGGTLLAWAVRQLRSIHPLPTRSLQSIRESLRWISNN